MSTETRTDVFASAFLVLEHTPGNFIPHPAVPAGGTNFADDNGNFWNQIAAGPINVGEGYIVRPQASYTDGNTTYNMTYTEGTLNNGVVNRTMVYNGASNPNGTPNVVANPYASPISADDFINANALVTEMYFWEHLTPPSPSFPGHGSLKFSMDDVSMYNLSGGVPAANDPGTSTEPNGIISTGQGFAVRAGSGGTVTFNNDMRRTTGNTTLRNVNPDINTLRLRVSNTQYEYELGSNTLIAFNPLATDGLDEGYDSNRLATVVSLFSSLNDGSEELGIQTRGAFTDSEKIALGFSSQVEERMNFTLSILDLDGTDLREASIFLIDNYTNIVTNLNETSYTFESGEGHFADRFTLQFEYETLGTSDLTLDAITVYPNPTRGIVNLASPEAAMTSVALRDLQGRLIRTEKLDARRSVTLDLNGLDAAMYFVTIHTEEGSVTKRIVLK